MPEHIHTWMVRDETTIADEGPEQCDQCNRWRCHHRDPEGSIGNGGRCTAPMVADGLCINHILEKGKLKELLQQDIYTDAAEYAYRVRMVKILLERF
jgi:hypothetical protein